MRLIDADALQPISASFDGKIIFIVTLNEIRNAPTIDAAPQWISVKERMPEKKDSYLVVKDLLGYKIETICGFTKNLSDVSCVDFDGNTNPGWYDYDSEYGYLEVKNVTHWMPLPEPPKEEKDGEE